MPVFSELVDGIALGDDDVGGALHCPLLVLAQSPVGALRERKKKVQQTNNEEHGACTCARITQPKGTYS